MPQMFPLNWILLFIYFTLIFITFIIMNYFSFNLKNKSYKMIYNQKSPKKNWLW
nr:ATP synthase F0 subunit 8 [Tomostethus sp. 1 QHW-2022a]UTY22588.1 ATP synthase F0 subunit 8 [Tomostethus sp. 1 QHW-2022a]